MKRLVTTMLGLTVSLTTTLLSAQAISVKASIDSVEMTMGDVAHINVSVDVPRQSVSTLQLVDFPVLGPGAEFLSFHGVDVVASDSTSHATDSGVRYDFDFTIQAFDPGTITIPPFEVVAAAGGDTVRSQALALKVHPVDVDSLETIHPITSVASPDTRWYDFVPDWLLWLIGAIVVAACAVYAFVKLRRHREVIESQKTTPIPPYDLAKQRLERLRVKNLAAGGHEKEYYTELVDILRQYLEGRFGINAMEMTSSQIIRALRANPETRLTADEMRSVLSVADFVKFAKVRPLPDDNVKAFNRAANFVDTTKPQPEPEAEPETNPKTAKKQ